MNYSNLNDLDFEYLCRDIMSRKLGTNLRRFGPGKDGGIDLTDDTVSKNIVVQVKHYQDSDTSKLIRALKAELPKVQNLNPKEYYICCSRKLTPKQTRELRFHFGHYMQSDENIITLLEIDEFLTNPENKDILEKHFKLWLESTGILKDALTNRLFVDSEVLLADIHEDEKVFVRTEIFNEALDCLEQNRTLCLIGNPGVGNSITSKILVLYYAAKGYKVRYTTDVADITTLKHALSANSKSKEIILLDDCFGQAYFEMQSSQCGELTSLIKFVKSRKNKLLILNSRITIFKEAQKRSLKLRQCEENDQLNIFVLDLNKMTTLDRAKILYNHLTLKGMPQDYLDEIKIGRRYRHIIEHANFNPRIIEFVTAKRRYQNVAPENYFSYLCKQLENPSAIWNDEYEHNLLPEDRILLQTIYSLSRTTVGLDLVRQCFNLRIQDYPQIDKTIECFTRSLDHLLDGFVVIGDYNGSKHISMTNPSINDFLDGRFKSNPQEKEDLLKYIYAANQISLLPKEQQPEFIVSTLSDDNINNILFEDNIGKNAFILHGILHYKVCNRRYTQLLYNFLLSPSSVIHTWSIAIPASWKNALDPSIWYFYGLEAFLSNFDNLTAVLNNFELEMGVDFIRNIFPLFSEDAHNIFAISSLKWLNKEFSDYCDVDVYNYSSDLDIDHAISTATYSGEIDKDEAAQILEDDTVELVMQNIKKYISMLPKDIALGLNTIVEDDINVNYADWLVDDNVPDPDALAETYADTHTLAEYEYDNEYDDIDEIFNR